MRRSWKRWPRAPQGSPAPDRHHQSRRRAAGDLGHGRDRGLRPPEALELFRKVLLASAAIPAVFPPGFIHGGGRAVEPMTRCMLTAARLARCSWCRRNSWRRRRWGDGHQSRAPRLYHQERPCLAGIQGGESQDAVDRRTRGVEPDQEPGRRRSLRALCVRQEKQHRLQPCLHPGRLPRYQHAGFRPGLYGQALRSRLRLAQAGYPWKKTRPAWPGINAAAAGVDLPSWADEGPYPRHIPRERRGSWISSS